MTWPLVPLSEVLDPISRPESVHPEKEYRLLGAHWYAKGLYVKDVKAGSAIQASSVYRVENADFVYNRLFAWMGSFAVAGPEAHGCFVSNEFPCFRVNTQRAVGRYLWYYFSRQSAWSEALGLSSGGTPTSRNRLKEEKLLGMSVPLPPVEQQRRIVAQVDAIASRVAEARLLREDLAATQSALWRSALNGIISGQVHLEGAFNAPAVDLLAAQAAAYREAPVSKHNNAHPGAPAQLSGPDVPVLPEGWIWTTLGSVLSHLVDCVNDTPEFSETPTGLLGLKSTNIKPYRLDLSQKWHLTPTDFSTWNRRQVPQEGDIVLTREAPMGQSCILPAGLNACLTQRLMLLRTDGRFVANRFVLHYLNSDVFLRQVRDTCRGLTTPHIRVQDAPNFLLPLPPHDEQRRIVAHLDALQAKLDAVRAEQSATAAELDALLPSVLNQAFAGKL